MNSIDILGLPLQEGIEILKNYYDYNIKIKNTTGLNKNFDKQLTEPRIIKVTVKNNTATLVVGYF